MIKTFDTEIPKTSDEDSLDVKNNSSRELITRTSDIVSSKRDKYVDNHVTVPSQRVSKTIDFSPKSNPNSPNTLKTMNNVVYPTSPYYCSPSQFLSLSPVLSFPFRHNELASPDMPAHTTGSSVKSSPQVDPPTPRIPSPSSDDERLQDHKDIRQNSFGKFYRSKEDQDSYTDKEADFSSMQSQHQTNQSIFRERTVCNSPTDRRIPSNIGSACVFPLTLQTNRCTTIIETLQQTKQGEIPVYPTIWRPIPQMASSPIVEKPFSSPRTTPYSVTSSPVTSTLLKTLPSPLMEQKSNSKIQIHQPQFKTVR